MVGETKGGEVMALTIMEPTVKLARRLVDTQFPQWAELTIHPIASSGTDNAMFRLGEQMCLRMPRFEGCAPQVLKEHIWLPHFQNLSLEVPEPIALGKPEDAYPLPWSILRWIDGEQASREGLTSLTDTAEKLASFLNRLQAIDPSEGPQSSEDNYLRGGPLVKRDVETRTALENIADMFALRQTVPVWEAALRTSWDERSAVWLHCDLHLANLLMRDGELAAVIDFGLMAVGDPACDLMIAYTLFEGASRTRFRELTAFDGEVWARARGWTLSVAARALDFHRGKNAYLADMSERAIIALIREAHQK